MLREIMSSRVILLNSQVFVSPVLLKKTILFSLLFQSNSGLMLLSHKLVLYYFLNLATPDYKIVLIRAIHFVPGSVYSFVLFLKSAFYIHNYQNSSAQKSSNVLLPLNPLSSPPGATTALCYKTQLT